LSQARHLRKILARTSDGQHWVEGALAALGTSLSGASVAFGLRQLSEGFRAFRADREGPHWVEGGQLPSDTEVSIGCAAALASGRTGARAKTMIPLLARIGLHHPERSSRTLAPCKKPDWCHDTRVRRESLRLELAGDT